MPDTIDTIPNWRQNLNGIRGAVGYHDSAGWPVVVINWFSLLLKPKINISAPGYASDKIRPEEIFHDENDLNFR